MDSFHLEYLVFTIIFTSLLLFVSFIVVQSCRAFKNRQEDTKGAGWALTANFVAMISLGIWISDMAVVYSSRERSTTTSRYLFWVAHFMVIFAIELGIVELKEMIQAVNERPVIAYRDFFFWRLLTPLIGLVIFILAMIISWRDDFSTQFHIPLAAAWSCIVLGYTFWIIWKFSIMIGNTIRMAQVLNRRTDQENKLKILQRRLWVLMGFCAVSFTIYLASFLLGVIIVEHAETVFIVATIVTYIKQAFYYMVYVYKPSPQRRKRGSSKPLLGVVY